MIESRSDLWRLLMNMPLGDAAEIGVAEGRFSLEMLSWPVNFPRVYMIDRWKQEVGEKGAGGYPQAWHDENLTATRLKVESYGERAIFMRGDSVEMADLVSDGSLLFVYIDCDHSYEGVRDDIEAWYPKLMPQGIMAFHDYESPDYPGVRKAVEEFCAAYDLDIVLIPELKIEDAGAYFRA